MSTLSEVQKEFTASSIANASPAELNAREKELTAALIAGGQDGESRQQMMDARVAIMGRLISLEGGDPDQVVSDLGGQRQSTSEELDELQTHMEGITAASPEHGARMQGALDDERQQLANENQQLRDFNANVARHNAHMNSSTGRATIDQLEALRDKAGELREAGNHTLATVVQARYDRESTELRNYEQQQRLADGDSGNLN